MIIASRYCSNHDSLRKGNFNEVIHGIERLREVAGSRIVLVTTISTLNFDVMEPMAQLAERMGAMISYNSVEPTLDFGLTDSGDSPNFQLGLSPEKLREFYATLLRLKREGYPLMETEQVLRDFVDGRPWKCEFPKMFLYVSPNKMIYSCDYTYGYDLRHGSFEDYFSSPAFLNQARNGETCNRCIRTCVRGYSYAYDLKPRNLVSLVGDARTLFGTQRKFRELSRIEGSVGPSSAEPMAAQ